MDFQAKISRQFACVALLAITPVLITILGCTRAAQQVPSPLQTDAAAGDDVAKVTPRVDTSELDECLQKVLRVPAVDATLISSADSKSEFKSKTIPLRTASSFAADGLRYELHIDSVANTVHITAAGGIADHIRESYGPWPVSDPNVSDLIEVAQESMLPNE